MAALRVLTRDQYDAYHRDGFLLVPGIFSEREMDDAIRACDQITYGSSYDEWAAKVSQGLEDRQIADGISRKDNAGRPQFPTGVRALDGLIENETYLDILVDLLGTDQLHYINGHLFVRAGPTDRRHPDHPWEGYHFDHDTGSFLPPTQEIGSHDYIGSSIALADITEDCAPTVLLPGSHRQLPQLLPRLHAAGVYVPPNSFTDIRRIPEFARAVSPTVKRGTVGFGSSYMVHAAVPFRDKTRQRVHWTLSVGRAANATHNRFGNAYLGGERAFAVPFWSQTTVRVRSLFGWPAPGDPYYTPETLQLLAIHYPAMDLTPYRQAVARTGAQAGASRQEGARA
jgi:hypothetical protein